MDKDLEWLRTHQARCQHHTGAMTSLRVRLGLRGLITLLGLLLATPGATQPGPELSTALIESRIAALRDAGAGDEDETLSAYASARALLERAASHERDATAYTEAVAQAPTQEAEIVARIEALEDAEPLEPADLDDVPPEALDSELFKLRAELVDATNERDALDRQLASREDVARSIRERLDAISVRLRELSDDAPSVTPSAPPSAAEASQWLAVAERRALVAERRAQEAQLTSQPARFSVRRARRTELGLLIEQLSPRIRAYEEVSRQRVAEIVTPEIVGIDSNDPAYGIATRIARENIAYARDLERVTARAAEAKLRRDEVDRRIRTVTERYDTAHRLVEFAGDSEVLGKVLIVHWHELDTYRMANPTRGISESIGDAVIDRINHEEALAARANPSRFVADLINDAGIDATLITDATHGALRDLVRAGREHLNTLIAEESDLIDTLSSLDVSFQRLNALLGEYQEFLGSWILWVASHAPLYHADFGQIPTEFQGLFATLRDIPLLRIKPGAIALLLSALALMGLRGRIGATVARSRDSILDTMRALFVTLLRAAPIPLLLWAASVHLTDTGTLTGDSLATVLAKLAVAALSLRVLQLTCARDGLGVVHFGWPRARCTRVAAEAAWFLRWWLPLLAVSVLVVSIEPDSIDAVLSRSVMVASLLAAAIHIGSRLARVAMKGESTPPFELRMRMLAIAAAIMLLASVIVGYFYAALVAIEALLDSLWASVALVLAYAVLSRWLALAQHHLRLTEQVEASAARNGDGETHIEEEQVALVAVSATTTELLKAGTATVGLLLLLYLWSPLLPALEGLGQVTLWTTTDLVEGEAVISSITLRSLLMFAFLLVATFYAARKIPALVDLVLRSRPTITPGARYAATTLLSYVIVGTGVIVALAVIGLEWSQLQWLVAALGVGIGFGLQEIVANFISGLIILFERPIRVGDVVSVGDKDGTVVRIRIRATTIRDWDGKELLVPNKEFITQRLLNWSLSDPVTRLVVNVGVAYGSDVERAMQILREVAVDHPRVMAEPEPSVVFTLFGDNSLNLALRCHVPSLEDRMPVLTDLHREINHRFNEAGVVIAFPQRDVHFDTERPLRIAFETKPRQS